MDRATGRLPGGSARGRRRRGECGRRGFLPLRAADLGRFLCRCWCSSSLMRAWRLSLTILTCAEN